MPTTQFANTGTTVSGIVDNLRLTTAGHPFINVTGGSANFESWAPGLREPMSFNINGRSWMDVLDMPNAIGYDIVGKLVLGQTDLANFRNAYLMCKALFQMQWSDAKLKWMNFIADGSTLGGTGPGLVGGKVKLSMTPKDRKMEMDINGYMFNEQFHKLLALAATAATGGSGGPVLGITAAGRVKANVRAGGILDAKWNTYSLGVIKDFKLDIETTGDADQFGRVISNMIGTKLELTMKQSELTDQMAAEENALLDGTLAITVAGPEIYSWVNALTYTGSHMHDEKERLIKLTFSGKGPYNADEAAPNVADLGVTTAGTATFHQIGYN